MLIQAPDNRDPLADSDGTSGDANAGTNRVAHTNIFLFDFMHLTKSLTGMQKFEITSTSQPLFDEAWAVYRKEFGVSVVDARIVIHDDAKLGTDFAYVMGT